MAPSGTKVPPGLDATLVLTGVTSPADLKQALVPPDLALDSLAVLPEAIRAGT